jgi:glycosyltransferase involved in cell wall biosynthesis
VEKALVIIPCLNEEKNIGDLVKSVKKSLPRAKILVIDDGSTDQTAQFAKKAGAGVVSHPYNLGYGTALQTGYQYALENNFQYVAQLDGDGQHYPEFLPKLLAEVASGRCDLALGSRFLGKYKYKMQFLRRLGILIFSGTIRLLTHQKITDPTSGFQAMNQKVAKFYASDIYPVDYPDADVLLMAHKRGFKIKERVKSNFSH